MQKETKLFNCKKHSTRSNGPPTSPVLLHCLFYWHRRWPCSTMRPATGPFSHIKMTAPPFFVGNGPASLNNQVYSSGFRHDLHTELISRLPMQRRLPSAGKGGVEGVYADENIWLTQRMNLPARHAVGYLRNEELITLSPALSPQGRGENCYPVASYGESSIGLNRPVGDGMQIEVSLTLSTILRFLQNRGVGGRRHGVEAPGVVICLF